MERLGQTIGRGALILSLWAGSLACSPESTAKPVSRNNSPIGESMNSLSIDEEIAEARRRQQEWLERFPDCTISDVDDELESLATRLGTSYPHRPLPPQLDNDTKTAIENIRRTDAERWQEYALDIQLASKQERALALANEYNRIAVIAYQTGGFLPTGSAFEIEMTFQGDCMRGKSLSLSIPILIQLLEESKLIRFSL